ncbi:MAG: 3'(2'),5'-bisphosphate nucleotidase CysQ [Alphaproteobacteria bacterium]
MSSKILSHRPALCNIVKRIAVEAGELVLEYFDGIRDLGESSKEDGSPVTLADREAEYLIERRLRDVLPDIPVIGEETFSEHKQCADLSGHTYFWLVDPIDGTKAFVRGDDDFTVNIALICDGAPVLGVIYAPAVGELYTGYIQEDGSAKSFRYFEDSDTEKEMRTRVMPRQGIVVVSGSYSGETKGQSDLLQGIKVSKAIKRSSSLKICMIANGKADLYPRFGPTCEWDTAAGHAILRGAGGDIVNLDGKSLRYGCGREDLLNPHFVALSGDILNVIEFPIKY